MVERILRNLLENALRYTPQGEILLGVRRRGENVRLDVIDTGIGVAPEKLTEIFEEFRQLNNPARDANQGLGLGLAIVDRLTRLMGTRMEVASKPRHGSRFSLVLPLDRAGPAAIQASPALDDAGGRILVIEDNCGLRQAYEMMLNDWGYISFGAATGEEALTLADREKWRFDAIVADHRLGPGLTGAEAAAEIARRAGRAFPTMIVTGDTAKERIAEIHASGFAMLHKPVEAAELRRRLAQVLRGAGAA
jgi:CheY-like chemotaxis protein